MDRTLEGQEVTGVCSDAAITILTGGESELRVETKAVLKTPDGDHVSSDPESPGDAAAPLVLLSRSRAG
ncbi:DUF6188 family protein [Streptomyces sp. NPDC049879]|uniref:DUF6188 family protein n=1 Tax=Streptomyces sp. NPDC049879 TaxID=3365598 RepID=UPI00379A93F5